MGIGASPLLKKPDAFQLGSYGFPMIRRWRRWLGGSAWVNNKKIPKFGALVDRPTCFRQTRTLPPGQSLYSREIFMRKCLRHCRSGEDDFANVANLPGGQVMFGYKNCCSCCRDAEWTSGLRVQGFPPELLRRQMKTTKVKINKREREDKKQTLMTKTKRIKTKKKASHPGRPKRPVPA